MNRLFAAIFAALTASLLLGGAEGIAGNSIDGNVCRSFVHGSFIGMAFKTKGFYFF